MSSSVAPISIPVPSRRDALRDAPAGGDKRAARLLAPVIARVLADDREYRHYANSSAVAASPAGAAALHDFVFATDADPADPADAFARLRWGGQFVYAARDAARVAGVARAFAADAFVIERGPGAVRRTWPIFSFLAPRVHYLIARKVLLVRPGEFTDRSTYHVELARHADGQYVVHKRVPTVESVVARLRRRFPDAAAEVLEKRARKFTDKIFPTFLTREAAMLKILQEHLPSRYAARVPHVIELEKDIRGFVTSFKMNWLRNGGPPLSQLQFAVSAADLLQAVHDTAGVLHLDLRLDNMVITEDGVGFVDFGSSVRVSENLATNPMLNTLFEELMRTSHIQRMLFTMTKSGQVTAEHLCSQQGKADKGIDVFYLALQFRTPHANPDLAGLIRYEPQSAMAREIAALSHTILRPANPADATHRSAKDVLRSLEMIEGRLAGRRH